MPLLIALALVASTQPRREVAVRDPLDGAARVYRGVPLLDELPNAEGQADSVLVRCLDGFVVLLPLELVRNAGPVIADELKTAKGWEPISAPRGPRYLVWPNVDRPDLDRNPDITTEGWAWGVHEVSLVSAVAYLAPLTPDCASRHARQGRKLWLSSCFHCHALSGAGGVVGWDLASPTPLWHYINGKRIADYLADPKASNPNAHMPAQRLTRQEISDLLTFLHAAVAP